MRSSPSPRALATRPSVLLPSAATQPATSTRRRDLAPLSSTPPAALTRPTALIRSFATPPAFRTWPAACKRYLATQPDFTTWPPVFKRSYPTQPVTTTQPTVITHSFNIEFGGNKSYQEHAEAYGLHWVRIIRQCVGLYGRPLSVGDGVQLRGNYALQMVADRMAIFLFEGSTKSEIEFIDKAKKLG
jgi:hypothetical protein